MHVNYQARWCSKTKADALRRAGDNVAMVLDSFNGKIVVEPKGADLGDGDILSMQEADQELRPVWSLERRTKLLQARNRLGLESDGSEGADDRARRRAPTELVV